MQRPLFKELMAFYRFPSKANLRQQMKKFMKKEAANIASCLLDLFLLKILIVQHLETAIRDKTPWNTDALRGLVVLDYCSYDAWQCQCRAVESVAKLNFLVVGMTIAAFQTVCLIALEV